MQFQKGQPRPENAGRKKGSKNKRSVPKVAEYLAEQDINPVQKILDLLKDRKLSTSAKIQVWKDLLSYCQGRIGEEPATLAQDGPSEDDETLTREQILSLVKNE